MSQFSTAIKTMSQELRRSDWEAYASEMTAQQFKLDTDFFFRQSGLVRDPDPTLGMAPMPEPAWRSST
jgi:hypothetical protein